jgi:fatty acid desaturase
MNLCSYKNAFGKPREGLRKYRIFDIAIFDVIVTMIIVYVLCWFTKLHYWYTLGVVFILGIFVHRAFCVRTGVDKMLFPDTK